MADKSPRKTMAKKPTLSVKEKRAVKKAKHDGSANLLGSKAPRSGS